MKAYLISLGCDKNLCDSEVMLGVLASSGYTITDVESEAEVIIINSCCFIGDAQEESINAIIEAGKYKGEGNCKYLIVTGCLSQRFREEIRTELPEVDGMLGISDILQIGELISGLESASGPSEIFANESQTITGNHKRLLSTGGHYAYIKIAEGCNKNCTYCVIPSVRGRYRSVPMEDIIAEAKTLAQGGVKELIIVSQESTLYGIDLYGKKMLSELLKELALIPDLRWIRILYCYPEEITDELIDVIATEDKIVNYLDLPIQSASDDVLKRMGRLTNKAEITSLIEKLRKRVPGITLRTTLITGFPGESVENHKETLEFVKSARFDRLGVFTYSREEGTKAADMPDQIPEEVKESRKEEIMLLQQKISSEKTASFVGKSLTVFVEGKVSGEDVYVGRTYMDAPEVDGFVFINSPFELISGDFVDVKITGYSEYDLIGDIVDESAE